MEYMEFSAKTVQDAITEACTHFVVTSSSLEYEVIEEGSTGFLGIGSKPAVIKARAKSEEIDEAKAVFTKEEEKKEVKKEAKKEKKEIKETKKEVKKEEKAEVKKEEVAKKREINVDAAEVEKKATDFLKDVLSKMEIENDVKAKYDSEENCLNIEISGEDKNMAFKVKRTRRSVTLEPMNPYERRVIHSALQNDSYVTTHSEGEEPYRKVVITLKK